MTNSIRRRLPVLRVALVLGALILLAYRRWKAYTKKAVAYWQQLMDDPEADVDNLAARLFARAANKVASLADTDIQSRVPEEFDFVLSGGGFKVGYALGVFMALASIRKRSGRARVRRLSGASAGAGVALGLLNDKYKSMLTWSMATAATLQRFPWMHIFAIWDRYWWHGSLPRECPLPAPGELSVSITRVSLFQGMRNEIVSTFPDRADLEQALMCSGAIPFVLTPPVSLTATFHKYRAIDGAATNNTPVFRDGVRPQFVIRYDHLPQKMIYLTADEMIELVERGIDELVEWVQNPDAIEDVTVM